MSRPVLVFLGAVLVPSLFLGGLALKAVQGQEALLDRQRSRIYEAAAEGLSHAVAARIDELQRDFSLRVESLIGKESPAELARDFDNRLRPGWPLANVGFAVSLTGQVFSPYILGSPQARQFLVRNEQFLCQHASVEVFAVTPKGRINLDALETPSLEATDFPSTGGDEAGLRGPMGTARFTQLVSDGQEGVVPRFVDDQLVLWLWYRTPRDPEIVFGAQLDPQRFREDLESVVARSIPPSAPAASALVDDREEIVATSPAGLHLDWRRPAAFRAIGEVLPHWTVAVVPRDPRRLLSDGGGLQLLLGAVVVLLLMAILLGGWMVIGDARRQLDLARRKSDFVSNVSHELRTPLTSIRLFAEMLSDGRIRDEPRRQQCLRVIRAEASRLNRLIANVLDFARLERGRRGVRREPVDLETIAAEVLQSFEPQCAAEGIVARLEVAPAGTVLVLGDADALAQVVNNLVSNAVKYAAAGGALEVRLAAKEGQAVLEVLDRGSGVPRGCEHRVFEEFFRAHDSLNSGIQGAGLGLTIARQIVRAHGGELDYRAREGGGCCFRVRLPRHTTGTAAADGPGGLSRNDQAPPPAKLHDRPECDQGAATAPESPAP